MNIQRMDDAVFLSYIAKYITKPEPNGILADTDELRARENMSDAERFLNCRIVGMPEACHRTWGFHMRAGTNVVHLITKIPHKRMRAIPRCKNTTKHTDTDSSSDSDKSNCSDDVDDEDSEPEETPNELRFLDGVLEQYMNRPNDADGQHEYWESTMADCAAAAIEGRLQSDARAMFFRPRSQMLRPPLHSLYWSSHWSHRKFLLDSALSCARARRCWRQRTPCAG